MKKLFLGLLMSSLLLGLIASPVSAASKGAVKADMVLHTDSGAYGTVGEVVGSVILNTTGNGQLIVVVNLDDANLVGSPYDSLVWINGVKIIAQEAIDVLKVNDQGQATANYKVDLEAAGVDLDSGSIAVKVVVRPGFSPNLYPCYVQGPNFNTAIDVPLK